MIVTKECPHSDHRTENGNLKHTKNTIDGVEIIIVIAL
jgi:hypothetical protein